MNLVIRHGRIIDPSQRIDQVGDLLILDGRIVEIGEVIHVKEEGGLTAIVATGLVVSPGFIDLHCHLREPGFEEKETIATGTAAAARGGFTTVCCMPNTDPPLDTPEAVKRVVEIATRDGKVRVLPIGCVTEGRQGQRLMQMAELLEAGVVAFSDDGSPVWNADVMRRALEESRTFGVPIIDHCEEPALARGGVMNQGHESMRLGYPGMPAAAEGVMVARDVRLARETGGRVHIAHVSTANSVHFIREAKRQGVGVTAEVTPHHLTMTEEAVVQRGAMAKVNPPLRTREDVKALVTALREGVIDAVATDHAPHTRADKSGRMIRSAFGISGLETALGSLMTLVYGGQLDLVTMIERLTVAPARILQVADLTGSLSKGSRGDITIFDPGAEWVVDPEKFVSKGKNTPLAGVTLRGKVMATVFGGKIVYRDESLEMHQR